MNEELKPWKWKLVPVEATEKMLKAGDDELGRWFIRRNKGQGLPYEVCRHSSDEVVSPIVMESFATESEAERAQFRLETAAAYRAMLAVAPEPSAGEKDSTCAHGTPINKRCEKCDWNELPTPSQENIKHDK